MDSFAFSPVTASTPTSFSINRSLSPSLVSGVRTRRKRENLWFNRKGKFSVFASKREEPKLNEWDQMELKFGRLIGEDPKLTIAKIMGKKVNPEASYLDIEKSFYKNKGKLVEIVEIPLDWSKKKKPSSSLEGLNLVRPVPKDGVKFETSSKPTMPAIRKPGQSLGKPMEGSTKARMPNVILRKPTVFKEDDGEEKPSKLRLQPNLSLKMRNERLEQFSDMTLLRKPDPTKVNINLEKKRESSDESDGLGISRDGEERFTDFTLMSKLAVKTNFEKIEESSGYSGLGMSRDREDGLTDFTLMRKPALNTNLEKIEESSGGGLGMSRDGEDRLTDFTLMRKPAMNTNLEKKEESSDDSSLLVTGREGDSVYSDLTILKKPVVKVNLDVEQGKVGSDFVKDKSVDAEAEVPAISVAAKEDGQESLVVEDSSTPVESAPAENEFFSALQQLEPNGARDPQEETGTSNLSNNKSVNSSIQASIRAALQGKPQRLDQSVTKTLEFDKDEEVPLNLEGYKNSLELDELPSVSPLEENDWKKAEGMLKSGERADVELISSSTRGFAVSFGSLIGFLPYRDLAAKWKFLAFESWLRRKGLDPSMYRQNLGVIGSNDAINKYSFGSTPDPEAVPNVAGEVTPDMELEDLLGIYNQEKLIFLSSYVGQRVRMNVTMAERKSRKLTFSMRPREKEEAVERRKRLMAKLRVGDIVKCSIKKITYFGIFVEVEEVPALIHQTEVSWDATLDPASYFKIGQIVEAKVHQLDFAVDRIFLSLKEVSPDPLTEALEFVVGDSDQLDGRLEAAVAESEWADVESLIKELQKINGIQSVAKGRFFLSPGLAPTFQVYMASMFANQYKLLARSENKVQELIIETSLSKEEMKSTILSCTNRVE